MSGQSGKNKRIADSPVFALQALAAKRQKAEKESESKRLGPAAAAPGNASSESSSDVIMVDAKSPAPNSSTSSPSSSSTQSSSSSSESSTPAKAVSIGESKAKPLAQTRTVSEWVLQHFTSALVLFRRLIGNRLSGTELMCLRKRGKPGESSARLKIGWFGTLRLARCAVIGASRASD